MKFASHFQFYTASSDPVAPAEDEGSVYYNTTTKTLRVFNGDVWVDATAPDTTTVIDTGGGGGSSGGAGGGTLTWAPPDTTGYTTFNIPTTGGSFTLDNTKDYILKSPSNATIDKSLQFTGGRNLVWKGGWLGGRKTQPSLTSSYDSTNRGVRFYDGADVRTIFVEGIYVETGTYLSDFIQIAQRTTNGVSVYIQNCRVDGIVWGNTDTTPDVHADAIQCWGGPTNMFVDGLTIKHATYQGLYWDPNDGRSQPTGTKVDWVVKNVNITGDDLTGYGVSYLLANRRPSFTNIQGSNIYTIGQGNNATDGFGQWPATGLTQSANPPGGDFVPASLWNSTTKAYTSPGYV